MFKKTAKGHAKGHGHAKFPVPASNPCPNGTCKTKPHAPVAPLHPLHVKTAYNACGFGTPYVCGAEEAQARGTNDPLVAALAGMGPLATCVFPGGGCTSTSLGACILGGGQVQSSGCCPGVTCIQAHVPGFVSEGCDKLPPNAVKHYGASAKLERRAVADVMGLLDVYTFGDLSRNQCRLPPHHPSHHHRSHGLTPGVFDGSAIMHPAVFDGSAVVHPAAGGFTPGVFDGSAVVRPAAGGFTPGVFDGSAVVRPSGGGGGASAAVAPVMPAMPGMPAGGFAFPAFAGGGGTSIYAPIVVPNNTGTVSIVNTQTAGPGARPPAVIPAPGSGKSGPASGKPGAGGASGSVFPGPGSAFVPGPGSVSGSVSGSVPVMPPFVPGPGPLIPTSYSVGSIWNWSDPIAPVPVPGPLIPTPYSYSYSVDISNKSDPIPLVPVPGPSPAVNTGGGVPAVPLSAIHFGNKRGVKTAISSVVAGARSGSAVLAHPRHMAHGAHTKLKKSAKTLPTDGLVVMVDGADDTGAAVGGVFHIPVGALLADQIYTVPPTMASSSHGHKCALQAKRHGSSLYLDLF